MTNNMDELNDKFKKSAENFSLIPSSGIWGNVKADIRRRERKRRFIVFFFIGAFILTGGIFLFTNHSTTVNTQTELQKNNPTAREHKATPQNIPIEKNYPAKENTSIPQTLFENKNQNANNEVVSQENHSANSVSSSTTGNISTSVTHPNSNQNNLAVSNPVQTQITTSITTTISPALPDTVIPDSATAIVKYTLQAETKTDSLIASKTDTTKKDTLIAQKDTIETQTHQSKWSIAIGVAPTLNFSKPQEQGDYQIISNYRDSSDKNLLTWNYHLAINYQIIPGLEIFTGIGIINFEQELLSKQAVYHYDTIINQIIAPGGPDTIITLGKTYFNINGDSTGTVKNKFSYFEIPIGIRYNFLPNHKFNIALQPEISFNKLIHSEGYVYNYQNFTYEKIKPADLKSWLVSYGTGISFQYAIRKNLCIEFTPYYKSFQKSIYNATYPVSQRFQQAEFRLSLRYLVK